MEPKVEKRKVVCNSRRSVESLELSGSVKEYSIQLYIDVAVVVT